MFEDTRLYRYDQSAVSERRQLLIQALNLIMSQADLLADFQFVKKHPFQRAGEEKRRLIAFMRQLCIETQYRGGDAPATLVNSLIELVKQHELPDHE